jgi:hypothetical protein
MDVDDEYHHMDQIVSGLWIGDLHSATDSNTLTANNIRSILTVMRGRFSIPEVRPIFFLTPICNLTFSGRIGYRPSSVTRFPWTTWRTLTYSNI